MLLRLVETSTTAHGTGPTRSQAETTQELWKGDDNDPGAISRLEVVEPGCRGLDVHFEVFQDGAWRPTTVHPH